MGWHAHPTKCLGPVTHAVCACARAWLLRLLARVVCFASPRRRCVCLPRVGCQDFLQVLSMFAGFNFDWPPEVLALFDAFSLVNFNFELLAPECSVSLNFEAKWCARRWWTFGRSSVVG